MTCNDVCTFVNVCTQLLLLLLLITDCLFTSSETSHRIDVQRITYRRKKFLIEIRAEKVCLSVYCIYVLCPLIKSLYWFCLPICLSVYCLCTFSLSVCLCFICVFFVCLCVLSGCLPICPSLRVYCLPVCASAR